MQVITHDGDVERKNLRKRVFDFQPSKELGNHFHEHALNINIYIIIPFLVVIRRTMTVKKNVNIINLEH